jgi:hypothetical protein
VTAPSFFDEPGADELELIDRIADETFRGPSVETNQAHIGVPNPLEEIDPPEVLRPLEDTKASGKGKTPLRLLPLGGTRATPLGGIPHGDTLRELDRELLMAAVAVGAAVVEGELVRCVLPDHDGEGHVERKPEGLLVYRCSCRQRRARPDRGLHRPSHSRRKETLTPGMAALAATPGS